MKKLFLSTFVVFICFLSIISPKNQLLAQCPDLTWLNFSITDTTLNEVDYSYQITNIGTDTAFLNNFGLQNYYSNDSSISMALPTGGSIFFGGPANYIAPGDTFEYEYSAHGTIGTYVYLIVSITDDHGMECTTANNKMVKVIAEDTAIIANFQSDATIGFIPLEIHFTDLSTGNPTIWEWDFNNDSIVDSYEQNPSWTFDTAGNYTIRLKASKFAFDDEVIKSDYISAEPIHVGLDNVVNDSKNLLYPNPAKDYVEISGHKLQQIIIYDIFGKVVLRMDSIESDQIQLDCQSLEQGLYFLRIKCGNSESMYKFLKL